MYSFTNINAYHQALQTGVTSCESMVQECLAQIAQSRDLNAFVEVYSEEAMTRARELDAQRRAGHAMKKLHGIVISIKDTICHAGHRVTCGSQILSGFESLYSATAIQRLLDEDAIVIGRCNCDEFGMGSSTENSVYGPTLNAIDRSRVPGGSSGGSAVSVQAGFCMAAIGGDTGGSIRQPADFCGLVGLKPTYGRVSRYGLIAYACSFEQIGVLTRSVTDAALLLEVMSGPDEYDSTALQDPPPAFSQYDSTDQKYRFACFTDALYNPALDPEIQKSQLGTIEQLRNDGHTVTMVDFPLMEYIVPAYYVLTTAEASSNLSRYDGVRFGYRTPAPVENLTDFYKKTRSEGFSKEVQRRIMLGTFVLSAGYYDAYYTKAQQVRRLLCDQTASVFNNFDAILMPVSPTTAFPLGEKTSDPIAMYLADIYTVFANLVGIPALALPLYTHTNGMPFGLQVMTKAANELTLLQMGDLLMQQYRQ